MAIWTDDILYQGQPSTSNTDLYTLPSSTIARITGIYVCNTSASTAEFSVHLVQNGDSVADDVALVKTRKLRGTASTDGGGIWTYEIPIPLRTAGDKISGIQTTSGACTVTIVGTTEAT